MLQIFTFFQLEKYDFDTYKSFVWKIGPYSPDFEKKKNQITKISQQVPAGSQNT
jgi:uncharacterized protein YwgA